MWGTAVCERAERIYLRFIPTHVGNSSMKSRRYSSRSVHPHACGEQGVNFVAVCRKLGSSPRMWGTGHRMIFRVYRYRFIPTHVGNSDHAIVLHREDPVHPHACGEQELKTKLGETGVGSSPRMWGTGIRIQNLLTKVRFIPTHVGNRLLHELRYCRGAVHPHACGEQKYLRIR